jgi:hypothetical protein
MKPYHVDHNHAPIRDSLRQIPGVSLIDMSSFGRGFPDLMVGHRGRNYLLEVKRIKKGKLNERQQDWHMEWKGQVAIVTTLDEALAVLGIAT